MKEHNNKFLGVFEISLFIKTGINHFDDNFSKMLWSFIFVAINFIFVLLTLPYLYESNTDLQNISLSASFAIYIIRFVLTLIAGLTFVYFFCKTVKRKHTIVKLITTANWTSLISLILFLPFFAVMIFGYFSYADLLPYFIMISLYDYAITAFIIRYIVDIPWELAAFMTICLLAINEFGFDLIETIV